MISHKTFTCNPIGLTSKNTQANKEKLRQQVEVFINAEAKTDGVISITETDSMGLPFSVTVWYQKRTQS